jgi:hypothetical protein
MEEMAELIASLWELRKQHREMLLENLRWADGPVRNFRAVGPRPHGDLDMAAVRDLIAEAEVQVRYLSCPSAFIERP